MTVLTQVSTLSHHESTAQMITLMYLTMTDTLSRDTVTLGQSQGQSY